MATAPPAAGTTSVAAAPLESESGTNVTPSIDPWIVSVADAVTLPMKTMPFALPLADMVVDDSTLVPTVTAVCFECR